MAKKIIYFALIFSLLSSIKSIDSIEINEENDCPNYRPIFCAVNRTQTCVNSQILCDCPPGYIKCRFLQNCVPKKYSYICPSNLYLYEFKFSRLSLKEYCSSNLRVDFHCSRFKPSLMSCPLGYYLCPDLTCKENLENCKFDYDTINYYNEADYYKVRCPNQEYSNSNFCKPLTSCHNLNNVVCPDGICYENDLKCTSKEGNHIIKGIDYAYSVNNDFVVTCGDRYNLQTQKYDDYDSSLPGECFLYNPN